MNEIESTLKEAPNEGTASPYWQILDPSQNMDCDIYRLASMITGPFFSREDAQRFLDMTRYNFSKRAVVFCHSGCYSNKYDKFYSKLENEKL